MLCRKNLEFILRSWGSVLLGGVLLLCPGLNRAATPVVAQLRNGDRITGELLAQETNHVIIATGWAGTLAIPLNAIGGVQTTSGEKLIPLNGVAAKPPTPPAKPSGTTTPPRPGPTKKIQTDLQFGSNLNFGAKDQELLYGRLKVNYSQPYESNPKEFFRSILDISADYGETESVESANRLLGSFKTDFDYGTNAYVYNVFSSGFDQIRKINLQYGAGPGVGYHALRLSRFELDLESGLDYQAQDRSAGEDTSSVYGRLGDSITWKISSRISFTKKLEYFFNVEDVEKFRLRLDSNLRFQLIDNLSLNLSVVDYFDTDPAPKVDQNELQIRTSIGLKF
ncbi:MAG: DUF481 domain-containing protein [Verrucomicrobiota bacterium]